MRGPNWSEKRLRYVLRRSPTKAQLLALNNAKTLTFIPMEAVSEDGRIDLSRTRPIEDVATGYSRFFDGDVLVARITPCFENGKGAVATKLVGGVGFGSTEFHVLSPIEVVSSNFLYFVTASADFRLQGVGAMNGAAGQQRVPEEFLLNYRIRIPDLVTQDVICDFLDSALQEIDLLVVEKQRLLNLLAEKRRTVIADFLTKGLNNDAPRRDSGIPWLGEIPAHWQIERAKWLFTERDDRSDSGDEELLTVSHLTGVTSRAEKDVNMFMAENLEGYKRCQAGDLVINTLWAWMGAMGVARQPGIVSPAYNVYQPVAQLAPEYVDLLVRTPRFVEEITRYSKGVWSSRLRLYPEGLYEARLPVPPLDEQQAIVKRVQIETQKLSALAEATERTIGLLQARRSALISAAVTGQIALESSGTDKDLHHAN